MIERLKYTAVYSYPGSFFPEDTSRELSEPTLAAALAVAPADEEGYFRRDGWYAVEVKTTTQKLFTAEDGEQQWINQGTERVTRVVIGERIHADDIEATERNAILIANIRGNTTDGYGVHTRCGNWQMSSDYDQVLAPAEVSS